MRSITGCAVVVLLSGCTYLGNGDLESELRVVDVFTEVANGTLLDVSVLVDEVAPQSLELTCDSNLLEHIQTEVEQGRLMLATEPEVLLKPRGTCTVDIVLNSLATVTATGSGGLMAYGTVHDLAEITNTGSGDVDVKNIDVGALEINSTGSGSTLARGTCTDIDIQNTGSGGADARTLIANNAVVLNTGSGDVAVHATSKCTIRLTGSGDVFVYGDPKVMDHDDTGSGEIVKR